MGVDVAFDIVLDSNAVFDFAVKFDFVCVFVFVYMFVVFCISVNVFSLVHVLIFV